MAKSDLSAEGLRKQRQEARRLENERMDEEDETIYAAHEVTFEADMLAMRLLSGTATMDELREFLDTDPTSNPYVSVASIESACMALGLDPFNGVQH